MLELVGLLVLVAASFAGGFVAGKGSAAVALASVKAELAKVESEVAGVVVADADKAKAYVLSVVARIKAAL